MTFKPPTIEEVKKAFVIFWSKYYQKKGKADAEKWWLRYRPDLSEVLASLELQKQEKDWLTFQKKFVPEWPYGSTYVHGKRWEDSIGYEFEKFLEKQKRKKVEVKHQKTAMRNQYSQLILEANEETIKQAYENNYISIGYRESLGNIRWLIDELRPEIKDANRRKNVQNAL